MNTKSAASSRAALNVVIKRQPVLYFALGMVLANVIGAFIVFGLIRFVLPLPIETATVLSARNFIAFAAYLPIAVAIGIALGIRVATPAFGWLERGGVPSMLEYRAVLSVPARQVAVNATLWIVGLIVFVGVNWLGDGGTNLLVVIAIAVFLGGAATCAMGYVVAERTLRPITAEVMVRGVPGRYTAPGVASRLLAIWGLSTVVPLLGSGLIALGQLLNVVIRPGDDIAAAVLALSVISLVVGGAGMILTARSIADPITQIIAAMADVQGGQYDTRIPVYDGSEVGRLQLGFNRMAATITEREHIRALFGMHVGDAVAARAIREQPTLGGELREVAVLFVDIIGSTGLADWHTPDQIVTLLNKFFESVVTSAAVHDGYVNKFEGDAALVVFGAPLPHKDPAGAALRTARELAQLDPSHGGLDAGIGVSFGSCLAGNVGAANRFEYTVIGDPVNEAARLSDLAKTDHRRVLTSAAAFNSADASEAKYWSLIDSVILRGRSTATQIAAPTFTEEFEAP